MNIITLIHTLRDGIHDDSGLQTWCQSTFGQAQSVFVGIDHRKPPEEDRFPLISVYPIAKAMGFDLEQADHQVLVTCGVCQEGELETGKANAAELAGFALLESFRKMVETRAALVAEGLGLTLSRVDVEYQPLEVFPFFMATMALALSEEYCQGRDVFA